jgi:hypothetical protein
MEVQEYNTFNENVVLNDSTALKPISLESYIYFKLNVFLLYSSLEWPETNFNPFNQ